MIDGLTFYKQYCAVLLHFKEGSSYDYFKYNGQTRTSEKSFLGRKDNYFFQKWAKKFQTPDQSLYFLAANMVAGKTYVRNFSMDELYSWEKYKESLLYTFRKDGESYLGKTKEVDPVELCFSGERDSHMFLIILNHLCGIFEYYDRKYGEDHILWSDLRDRLIKQSEFVVRFLEIDKHKSTLLCIIKEIKENHAA